MRIGLTKDGWPKKLLFLKPLVDEGGPIGIKIVLTILNFSRAWDLSSSEWNKVDPKFDNIIKPQKCDFHIFDKYLQDFVRINKLKLPLPKFDIKDMKMCHKGGPQGPASSTSMMNLEVYTQDQIDNLLSLTDNFGKEFLIDSFKSASFLKEKSNYPIIGKLSFVKDPEAKLRVIAISDYYTQLVLKPVHKDILSLLRGFKTDRTFTQKPFHRWKDNGELFYSLDLSAATDRFPISLQERLLSFIYDKDFSLNWRKLLSEREFGLLPSDAWRNKGKISINEIETFKYSTGQPMGTYSSWAVFTLTHHFIVYFCARLNGFKTFNQYIILGDDIVIKNDAIAKTYIEVMEGLGVEISTQKTHVSKTTYEFAKRWIRPFEYVKELTGIPLKGIISNFRNPQIVFTILYDFFKIKNNPVLYRTSLVNFLVNQLYGFISIPYYNKKVKKIKFFIPYINKKVLKQILTLELALDQSFGFLTYEKFRNFFNVWNTNDELVCPPDLSIGLLYLRRILTGGIASTVSQDDYDLTDNLWDVVFNQFHEIYKSMNLTIHPQFMGLVNLLEDRIKILNKFKSNSNEISLYNIAKDVVSIKVDRLFNKEKQKLSVLLEMGKLISRGFQQHEILSNEFVVQNALPFTPELRYFNDIILNYELALKSLIKEFTKDHLRFYLEMELQHEADPIHSVIWTYTRMATILAMSTPPDEAELNYYGRPIPRMWRERWNEWCY